MNKFLILILMLSFFAFGSSYDFIGIDNNGNLYEGNSDRVYYDCWTPIQGMAKRASISYTGKTYVINQYGNIFTKFPGQGWNSYPSGFAGLIHDIEAPKAAGQGPAVSTSHGVFKRTSTWVKIFNRCDMVAISLCPDGDVYMISGGGQFYVYSGGSVSQLDNAPYPTVTDIAYDPRGYCVRACLGNNRMATFDGDEWTLGGSYPSFRVDADPNVWGWTSVGPSGCKSIPFISYIAVDGGGWMLCNQCPPFPVSDFAVTTHVDAMRGMSMDGMKSTVPDSIK